MYDAIVVGCGIIGATVVQSLRNQGRSVLAVDKGERYSATKASGGHVKESWSNCSKEVYQESLRVLEETWGAEELEFDLGSGKTETVFRVDTDKLILSELVKSEVIEITNIHNFPVVKLADGREERARLLLVSAGVWCGTLLDGLPTIAAKAGVSFRTTGTLDKPFIKPWAPYKQIVAHQQRENEIWIGDGSAILAQNWTDGRTEQCENRCLSALDGGSKVIERIHGWRPYCEHPSDEPCLFRKVGPRAWVATGAGKNGTVSAGWIAGALLGVQ